MKHKINLANPLKCFFPLHKLNNVTPKVPKQHVPPEGHRRCTSTYYQPRPIHNGDKHSVTNNDYHSPTTKPRMVSKSVYKGKHCFTNCAMCTSFSKIKNGISQHGLQTRENFKLVPQTQEHIPFDGTTTYRLQYIPYPVQPRKPSHQDYKGLRTLPQSLCPKLARPPVQALVKSKEPLQARATTKVDYKAWDTVRCPHLVQKQMLERPKGTFEKTTTSRLAYMSKTAQRVVSCKPMHKPLNPRCMLG
ncbi:uncharacterized protein LOC130130473 [Lampris incognitus]|uniref:uncharacterized protein LOC130130473 n=1 Tax=Lampris incognitus TaxID=2546036 RepID=UPI0024B5A203|nr:uncharacterized protein LOC130130473 [Lampris incognitus]